MRCKTCEYPLWNLSSRQCPECGAGFKPSDFEFTLNSVQFRCPHCSQPYYGTGANGHLVPAAFTCVSCNTPVKMDDMVLLPTEGVSEDLTKADEMPWLARGKLGIFRAFFSTLGRSMAAPAPLIRLTPVGSSAADACLFGLIALVTVGVLSVGLFLGLAIFGTIAGAGGGRSVVTVVASFCGTVLGSVIAALAFMLLWAAAAHITLRLTGPTQAGYKRTLHAIAYSSGCNIISAIPCLGIYIIPLGFIWWAIAALFMVRDGQRVTALRASFAVLWLPVVLLISSFALLFWGFSALQTQIQAAQADARAAQAQQSAAASAADGDPQSLAVALFAVIDSHRAETGRYPDHALELLASGGITLSGFVSSAPDANGIRPTDGYAFKGIPFHELAMMPNDRLRTLARTANAAFTDPAGPHRIGDVVCFWKGLDPQAPGDAAWLFVIAPREGASTGWIACAADGSLQVIPADQLLVEVAAQNILRESSGLPRLPDPRDVTDDSP